MTHPATPRAETSVLAILKARAPGIFALCWRILRHRQDAEDVAQEVLIKAARELPRLRDPERQAPWLHRVTVHAALDALRRRGRILALEGRATERDALTPTEEVDLDGLHRALGLLEDEERSLVIEHYFQHRTLRDIADERGCSEPAVWKRVERAKEKLRQTIWGGSLAVVLGAASRLDALLARPAPVPPSVDLVVGRVARTAAAAGKGMSLWMPLLLPLAVGLGVSALFVVRESRVQVPSGGPALPTRETPLMSRVERAASTEAPAPAATSNRPYPFRLPPEHWPDSKRKSWSLLRDGKLTLEARGQSLRETLSEISRQSGLFIQLPAELPEEPVTFLAKDIRPHLALRLLLHPRKLGHALLDDGTVLVASDGVIGAFDTPDVARIERTLADIDGVRRRMEGGWDGTGIFEPVGLRLRTERGTLGDEPDTLDGFMVRFSKAAAITLIRDADLKASDLPAGDRDLQAAEKEILREEMLDFDLARADAVEQRIQQRILKLRLASLERRTLPVTGERTLRELLDALCGAWGLGYRIEEDARLLTVCSRRRAEEVARESAGRRATHEATWAKLNLSISGRVPATVPELVEAGSKELGIDILPSEEAWTAALPKASTWRGLIDGLRWGIHEGKVILLR